MSGVTAHRNRQDQASASNVFTLLAEEYEAYVNNEPPTKDRLIHKFPKHESDHPIRNEQLKKLYDSNPDPMKEMYLDQSEITGGLGVGRYNASQQRVSGSTGSADPGSWQRDQIRKAYGIAAREGYHDTIYRFFEGFSRNESATNQEDMNKLKECQLALTDFKVHPEKIKVEHFGQFSWVKPENLTTNMRAKSDLVSIDQAHDNVRFVKSIGKDLQKAIALTDGDTYEFLSFFMKQEPHLYTKESFSKTTHRMFSRYKVDRMYERHILRNYKSIIDAEKKKRTSSEEPLAFENNDVRDAANKALEKKIDSFPVTESLVIEEMNIKIKNPPGGWGFS